MPEFLADLAIVAAVVILFIVAMRRSGQQNPVGTKTVIEDVSKIKSRQSVMENELVELKADVDKCATTAELARLEAKLDGHHALAKQTAAGVRRIEDHFLQKGMNK